MDAMRVQPATELGSYESRFRLNQIDKVRAKGGGDHVSLPQLVVCGDQSAGKSSVLERLTDIPFPRKEGLCTRFATEIILRHNDGPREIVATIRADSSRGYTSQDILHAYRKVLPDFSGLPTIIAEASALMGLRGPEAPNGSAFALDALRIEVSGPTGLHLTIVDLPGLISVSNEEQSDQDVDLVHGLVDTYLQSSRTIILAVVQAGNDIANQPIIRKAKNYDPEGLRTVGVITKPDLINNGTEYQIARLANNEGNVKLKLGFFILKNPSPMDVEAGHDAETLARLEKNFFAQPAWRENDIDPGRIGSAGLQSFLQVLLLEHIEREIPKVRQDLRKRLLGLEVKLKELGNPRPTLTDIRSFLIQRSMYLHQLAQDSLLGQYLGAQSTFFDKETRLRALVHQANSKFAEDMRLRGSKRVVAPVDWTPRPDSDVNDSEQQLRVTRDDMLKWVKEVYYTTRGLELPGDHNHVLQAELFQIQASRWPKLSEGHLRSIVVLVKSWLRKAVTAAIQDEELKREIITLCYDKLHAAEKRAFEELEQLWKDEQRQPITYNHYYTDNIQKARNNFEMDIIQKALKEAVQDDWNGKLHISNNPSDLARLISALQNRVTVNMDDRACKEALEGMEAYYKVSRKTFVDNVCRQVIERHVLGPLPTFFSPTSVSELPDEEVLRIGSEPDSKKVARDKLAASVDCMRLCLQELEANPHD